MTITIDLPPKQEERLRNLSRKRGIQPQDYVTDVVWNALSTEEATAEEGSDPSGNDASIALLESWIVEGAKATPEEIQEAEKELQEFKEAMNESRRAVGARILYP